jgi:hypothetical protein
MFDTPTLKRIAAATGLDIQTVMHVLLGNGHKASRLAVRGELLRMGVEPPAHLMALASRAPIKAT